MARNIVTKEPQGGASGQPPEETHQTPMQVAPNPSTYRKDVANVPPPRKFRVVVGGHIMVNGSRTGLRTGKIIDAANYDIDNLQLQGVRLEEIAPPQTEEQRASLDASSTPYAGRESVDPSSLGVRQRSSGFHLRYGDTGRGRNSVYDRRGDG